jgi:hypothetical protein
MSLRIQKVMKRGGAGDIERQLIHDDLKNTSGVIAPNDFYVE